MVGIDTVALSFPVVGECRYHWLRFGSKAEQRGHLSLRDGWARVEASLARRTNGERPLLLDPAELVDAALDLAHDAERFVRPATGALEPRALRIVRIDPAVDFSTTTAVTPILRGLAQIPVPSRAKRMIVEDHTRRETVNVGTKSAWLMRAYDKERKGGRTGVLRVEAQLRTRRLQSVFARENGGMIKVLADATPAKVESLWRATFEHVGFGAPVVLDLDAAVRALNWTSRRVIRLLGVLEAQRLGLYSPGSRHTRRTDAELVRAFHDELGQGGHSRVRLDVLTGKVSAV